MTPRPALAATIAASLLVLGATGALAAGSPQLTGRAPDKTSPTTAPLVAPTTTVPTPTTSGPAPDAPPDDLDDARPRHRPADRRRCRRRRHQAVSGSTTPISPPASPTSSRGGPRVSRACSASRSPPSRAGSSPPIPSAPTPIPGCGFPGNTSYQEVSDYGAFYCPDGDYMAYDDGELGVIYELAERFSPSVVAVVMAHEFGHAVQFRTDALDRDVPTIYTEQQADCFSGAWARRVWDGQAPRSVVRRRRHPHRPDRPRGRRRPDRHERPRAGRTWRSVRPHRGISVGVRRRHRQLRQPHRQAVAPASQRVRPGRTDVADQRRRPLRLGPGEIMDLLSGDLTAFWPPQVAANGTTMPAVTLRPSPTRRPTTVATRRDGQLRRRVLRGDQRGVLRRVARSRALRRLRRLRRGLRDRPGLGGSRAGGPRQHAGRASRGRWRRTAWSGRGSARGSTSTRDRADHHGAADRPADACRLAISTKR